MLKINKKISILILLFGVVWAPLEAFAGRYDQARAEQAAATKYAEIGEYENAIAALWRALDLRPNHPGIIYTMAAYSAQAGDYAGAHPPIAAGVY